MLSSKDNRQLDRYLGVYFIHYKTNHEMIIVHGNDWHRLLLEQKFRELLVDASGDSLPYKLALDASTRLFKDDARITQSLERYGILTWLNSDPGDLAASFDIPESVFCASVFRP